MPSFAKKYNPVVAHFDYEIPESHEYKSLEELYSENPDDKNGVAKVYPLKALYINRKSKFGDSPVGVTEDCLVNLPKHMTPVVKEILSESENIDAINKGAVGFKIYQYTNDFGVNHSIEWVDI